MEKLAYILQGGSPFSDAVNSALLLEEFVIYQATLAGLDFGVSENNCHTDAKGGVFLRADADFDPNELGKVIKGAEGKDVCLSTQNGDVLGYVLTTVQAEDTEKLSTLPRVLLRHSDRITAQNYSEVLTSRKELALKKYRDAGVFFESEEVTLSPLYTIGTGTFIGRGTILAGSGSIGKNCAILGGRLHNAVLGDGVKTEQSVLLDCRVGDNTTVGPFAYLRPNTDIGKGARIGDFVEIKNSTIDDGTKVSHLTYIGDSDVGKGVNFGCGTVTSNYDGLHKYRTVIGDHAFIGCNTNLVAPVTVGDNAYIAAGSTITDEVPAASLAIARERQTNKENWVNQNKPELIK